tara:strand:- start:691 stop:1062 length:372 start_codon:yes stop_codon:yes gene_type:complete
MNTLMLVALAVVVLCYCGGRFCPSVLKQNKELVLGVLVGMALCSFTGLRLEGIENEDGPIYGGKVTGSRNINRHLTNSSDLIECSQNMTNLFTSGTIDATQHLQAVQACNTRFSDDASQMGGP